MEENEGKKPIKIMEDAGKKPVKIDNNETIEKQQENKNSGFVKSSKKISKKLLAAIIAGIIAICIFLLINAIPTDIETIKDSVVMLRIYDKEGHELGTGSGFCAYKSNYIVTNFHVIEGAYKIEIVTDDNKTYKADKIEIFNKNEDLAIISGNFELSPLKIGNSISLKAGQKITAIGSPMGQLNTVSTGIVSNADNDYQIRITAPISPR